MTRSFTSGDGNLAVMFVENSDDRMNIFKRDTCLVCGEHLPLLQHMLISCINGAECPACHSYMRFKFYVCFVQILLFICIFPALSVFQENKFLGLFLLIALIISSSLVAYIAPYKIDSAHTYRLKRHSKKNT